jgi:putative radical SAM enzyme (TIGR03279 family)
MPKTGGVIREIAPGSLAEAAGLHVGDVVEAVNGRTLCDVIDYKFYTTEPFCTLSVRRDGETFAASVSKDPDEDLGLRFEDDLFDGIRRCRANCTFCFVDQLPGSVRPALKVKDDDFRLSFLHGDYVSLSNLSDGDFARIAEQRLSPLYVSVHTTNPDVRRKVMRGPATGEIMEQLRRLVAARIEVHAQIVICPGTNDGTELDRTVSDLGALFPGVRSVSVVPVGLTSHRQGLPEIRPVTPESARRILRDVRSRQREFRARLGTRFVFASDEVYLCAGSRLPSRAAYEEFPQLDNGVGEARLLLHDLSRALRRLKARPGPAPVGTLVTGRMCAPILEAFAEEVNALSGGRLGVFALENRFLGPCVTTAGLLAGRDIIEQVESRARRVEGPLYIPRRSLREDVFIDDGTLNEVAEAVGIPVIALDTPADVVPPR